MKYRHIISLGWNCFMRALIDKFNIRKKYPIRMPFDGSIHHYDEMCRLIYTEFADYYDNIQYIQTSPTGQEEFQNDKGVKWLHEKYGTTREELIVQLKKRVEQFREVLYSGEKVLFLLSNINNEGNGCINNFINVQKLIEALHVFCPDLDYSVFILGRGYCDEYKFYKNIHYLSICWQPNQFIIDKKFYHFFPCSQHSAYGNVILKTIANFIFIVIDEDREHIVLNKSLDYKNLDSLLCKVEHFNRFAVNSYRNLLIDNEKYKKLEIQKYKKKIQEKERQKQEQEAMIHTNREIRKLTNINNELIANNDNLIKENSEFKNNMEKIEQENANNLKKLEQENKALTNKVNNLIEFISKNTTLYNIASGNPRNNNSQPVHMRFTAKKK